MRTESQTRWEKGVDPHQAQNGIRYAVAAAGRARRRQLGRRRATTAATCRAPAVISFRPARTAQVTGLEFDGPSQVARLERLGFRRRHRSLELDDRPREAEPVWDVTVPSWRARDVRREIDLVEEVARFKLERVPTTLPVRQAMFGRLTHFQRLRRLVEDVLVGAGFYEAYTYSLQPSDPDPRAIELPVPLSSQQRFLRTNLVQGLVGAARHNVDMGNVGCSPVRGRARLSASRAGPQQGAARALARRRHRRRPVRRRQGSG